MAKNPLIYVIDDNAMLRALINQQLQNTLACEVVSFEHADNVLDDWNSVTPDLVILDYQFEIPDLKYKNGLQFLHALRSQSNVPVIALTGQSEKEVMSTLIKQGANDYIPKDEPQFLETLMSSVQTILSFQETQRQLKTSVFNVNAKFLLIILLVLAGLIALGMFI